MLKKWFSLSALLSVILVVILTLPGISDLFKPGYYSSHDGEGHIIRMDEFYHAFLDGQFPVRWSKRLYFGYGYPFFNFNYPSTYYFALPVMLAGFSATTAMKTETIVMYMLSALAMFFYLRRKVSWQFAIVGAILYAYAPYRLLNMYVRGSVAESTAFLFPPLLLWTSELMAERKPKAILFAAVTLFLLGISHNISALLLFGFFFMYAIFLSIGQRSLRPFIYSTCAFVLGLMMAAFFFIPALAEKKYTFLDQTIAKDYPDHFVYVVQLVKSGWGFGSSVAGMEDGLSFNIGWVQLAVVVIGSCWLLLQRKFKVIEIFYKDRSLTVFTFSFTLLVGAIFFMLPPSRFFWDHLPLLPFVQFPWRFLLLTVSALAVMSAITLHELARTNKWSEAIKTVLAALLIAMTLFIAKDQWHINQSATPKTIAGDALQGSTTWADEQATHWFLPKPNKIPDQKIEFVNKAGKFVVQKWFTGKHIYSVVVPQETVVVENTMYYPGWEISVDGHMVTIDYQNAQYPGRITYPVTAGEHQVVARFTETPLRKCMDVISLITLIVVSGAIVWPNKKVAIAYKSRPRLTSKKISTRK